MAKRKRTTKPSTPEQREAHRLSKARRRAAHPPEPRTPEQRQAKRDWYAAHPLTAAQREAKKLSQRARDQAHPKKHRKRRNTAYYAAHREERLAYAAAWNVAHPEARAAMTRRRRALKAGALVNDSSDAQWQEVLGAFGHRCAYCPPGCKACKAKMHKLTQDHITPFDAQGSHTLHNVVPACQTCNSRKHTKPAPAMIQPLLLTLAPSKPSKPGKEAA